MTEDTNRYVPRRVSPPGSTLLDLLEERGMAQNELADRTGLTPKTINEIIKAAVPLTRRPFAEVAEALRLSCAGAGVAVALVPGVEGCRASGVARWLSPSKALIQLSDRHKTEDHLWFTFFHEAAHVLLHGKKAVFMDDGGGDSISRSAASQGGARMAMLCFGCGSPGTSGWRLIPRI